MSTPTSLYRQDSTSSDRRQRPALSARQPVRLRLRSLLLLLAVTAILDSCPADARHAWERPGCHQVGHTRRISLPGCVEFDVTTNACRGYCESYSVPSTEDVLRVNSKHVITCYGQCCDIVESEDVRVKVMCLDGPRDLLFKSARSCSCYHCKKE